MITTILSRLTARGLELDTSPESFGELRPCIELIDDVEALRQRMDEDGYLYLPGYLDRDEVIAARRGMLEELAKRGFLDPNHPISEAVPASNEYIPLAHNWAHPLPAMQKLLYSGRMMQFYERFLGGEVRHFDFTWTRVMPRNLGTSPHMDIVYMGRGTTNLYTSWTPLSDMDLEMGGLMILENSHHCERVKSHYGRKDVDTFCSNRSGHTMGYGGWLSKDPIKLRKNLGGRWLTAEYKMGDLLVFSMYTIHASLDNQSDRLRISSDTRYQLASDPVDERWIGPNPIAHGPEAKRGVIC